VPQRNVFRLTVAAAVVIAAIGVDQSTKFLARTLLKDAGTAQVIGDFFILRYAENQGAFLSLGSNWPVLMRRIVFGAFTLAIVVAAIAYMIRQDRMNLAKTSFLSLIVGGGLGNLLDRLTRGGCVADFMNLGIGRVRTGIFNFADLFIMAGILLFILAQTRAKAA
jgi:signal peptidase II